MDSHHRRGASHPELIESFTSGTPHQLKNTPRKVVLPLYCSSSAPEAIHHTTHWIRVLHHNGGPNQYKPRVSCVVHHASLEFAARLWACFSRERSSCAPSAQTIRVLPEPDIRHLARLVVVRRDGESSATLGTGSASICHGCDEAMGRRSAEGIFRCTPTWRAKCRISGFGKTLNVRTLGCARRSSPYRNTPSASPRLLS